MTLAVIHGAIIAFFLWVGARMPRRGGPVLGRDTLLNLVNGGLLASLRLAVLTFLAGSVAVARCDLSAIKGFLPQLLVVFLISDFTRYWLHYLHHRVDFLWQFHAVHHSSPRLDATAGLRMHVVDFVQLSLVPLVLFGLLFDASSFDPRVWPVLVIITDLFDAFQHADIDLTLDHPVAAAWGAVFNNPVFHSWHHSTNPGEHNGNFGQALTLWDRLFNTHVPHATAAPDAGLPLDEQLEDTLWGLQLLTRASGRRPTAR